MFPESPTPHGGSQGVPGGFHSSGKPARVVVQALAVCLILSNQLPLFVRVEKLEHEERSSNQMKTILSRKKVGMFRSERGSGFSMLSAVLLAALLWAGQKGLAGEVTSTTLGLREARAVAVAMAGLEKSYGHLLGEDDGNSPVHVWKEGNVYKVWFKPTYYEKPLGTFYRYINAFTFDEDSSSTSSADRSPAIADSVSTTAVADVVIDDRWAVEYTISEDGKVLHIEDSGTTTWKGRVR